MTDHEERLARARSVLAERDLDALLVGPSADLFWLTGYRALPLERLTLLIVPAHGEPTIVVPELEAPRCEDSGATHIVELVAWKEEQDPTGLVLEALRGSDARLDGRFAVQDRLWSVFLLRLQDALPDATWHQGGLVARELRITKSEEELEALRGAGWAIDAVHRAIPELLRPGRTEAEVGRDISELILEDHDEVNFVIVASGPNGASPHHETGARTLQAGDAVVIDIGGTREGYCSDMTRNYVLGDAPDGYRELHEVLEQAQRAGVDAVAPGVPAEEIDATCRRLIADAGYGDRFVHRTGHGIGVEEHEEPYLVGGNGEPLRSGMTFSVEPGIYVPGRYGARIEDIVAVTDDGVERLNLLERGLVEVPL
ncbi:MAG: Xaa-Pro peptidase family protein [Actinobacteria bacterium]|nr:Xaa-Pro peptidase family protein [Actinomycetota bacterium]